MARTRVQAPAYLSTLQTPNNQGMGGQQAYNNAVTQKYNAGGSALTNSNRTADGTYTGGGYDAKEAATYAQQEQQRYQGGPAVSSQQLGQVAYDQAQRQNLQAVGAQRGSGGQAQGLRAAMMGTTGASSAQSGAQVQANQEQVAQRQAILQQRLASESAQQQAARDWQAETDRFNKEKEANDADTQAGMFEMVGNAISDRRAKKVKRTKAPSLVIMLGGGRI